MPADESAIVDKGLGEFNDQAAPLHEVRTLSCFVRDEDGRVIGGVIGRRWGQLCELQQLWVEAGHRGRGLGVGLVREFERHAVRKGCTSLCLETLSFQAPDFYLKLGYTIAFTMRGYPHDIRKYQMVKELGSVETVGQPTRSHPDPPPRSA
jgi:ribosomal protein S18 acetylase RimI-like enzyme